MQKPSDFDFLDAIATQSGEDLSPFVSSFVFQVTSPSEEPIQVLQKKQASSAPGSNQSEIKQLDTSGIKIKARLKLQFPADFPSGRSIEIGFIQGMQQGDLRLEWGDGTLTKHFQADHTGGPMLDVIHEATLDKYPWYQKEDYHLVGSASPYLSLEKADKNQDQEYELEMSDHPGMPVHTTSKAAHLQKFSKITWDTNTTGSNVGFLSASLKYQFTTWLVLKVGLVYKPLFAWDWHLSMAAEAGVANTIEGPLVSFEDTPVFVTSSAPVVTKRYDVSGILPKIPESLLKARQSILEYWFNINSERRQKEQNFKDIQNLLG